LAQRLACKVLHVLALLFNVQKTHFFIGFYFVGLSVKQANQIHLSVFQAPFEKRREGCLLEITLGHTD
jgi:putative methionine-R-sulfoxide reductase with GAF domain